MAVRYPAPTRDEGTTPPSPGRDVQAQHVSATAPVRALVHPSRLPAHTPARGAERIAAASRSRDSITCAAPAAVAMLVREALVVALPGVPVSVAVDDTLVSAGTRRGVATSARTEAHGDADVGPEVDDAMALAAAWEALRRTQQRVAASEVAMGLQHALANPLTALLFEAQLLQMEALPPVLAEAVGRIVTQCRRTIEVARRLDAAAALAVPAVPAAASPRHDIRNPM